MRFMDNLIIRDEDTFCMKDPLHSCGGVRLSLTSTAVRIDFVSHLLLALVKGVKELTWWIGANIMSGECRWSGPCVE